MSLPAGVVHRQNGIRMVKTIKITDCDVCMGEGLVHYYFNYFWDGTQIERVEICPKCKGTGNREIEADDVKEAD